MEFCFKSFCVALIIFVVTWESEGQLTITGAEEPLIIGLPRDIYCRWTGNSDVSVLEWFVDGLGPDAIETATNTTQLVLPLEPDSDSLDGTMFTCKATLFNSNEVEESITLSVKALQNEVNITSFGNATAGGPYILTCTVSSERPPNISWIGPDGNPPSPDITIQSEVSRSGMISIMELIFGSVRTSQSGQYKCISVIAIPPSRSEASFVVQVQIPEPTVSIYRSPEHPTQLFTTDSLLLTCVIELIPEIDTPVSIRSQWRGHTSLSDNGRRVVVSDLEGVQLMYNSSVAFSTLKSVDSGTYICSATVSPLTPTDNLIGSGTSEGDITISVVLKVTISVSYSPPADFTLPSPPYYRPATSVTLTCHAHSATGMVTYEWSSTCISCFATGDSSQTISDSILTSYSAGVHTCTANDSVQNTGSNSTQMKLIGAGLYIDGSPAANNSYTSQGSYYSTYRIYCYSNSTSNNVGYFTFPSGSRYYSGSPHNHYLSRQNPSGIQIYKRYTRRHLQSTGIFTCELPDSEGNTVETSVGIYSSTPSAPTVYSSQYTEMPIFLQGDLLGILECHTQYSPPTNMAWLRDGEAIHVDGWGYETMQIVTDRSNSRYKNTLLIRNATELVGNHSYTCSVSNTAGSASQTIQTTLTAHPIVDINVSGEPDYLGAFNMTCRASLKPRITSQLSHYLVLDWVRVDGEDIQQLDGVSIGEQQFSTDHETTTRNLVFDPLIMAHGGDYRCEAKLILPDNAGSFNTTLDYHLNVLERTLIQLKFGPTIHCSKWYEDKRMATYLDQDIKRRMTDIINEKCNNCNFQTSQIDKGEFSCRTIKDGDVIYRARLEGNTDTLTKTELLALIQEWINDDGTFLFTYHGNIRLGLDPLCPLEIASFSQPECHSRQAGQLREEL